MIAANPQPREIPVEPDQKTLQRPRDPGQRDSTLRGLLVYQGNARWGRGDVLPRARQRGKVVSEPWHGKENPAVPTTDGVREPRNRRVEIAL